MDMILACRSWAFCRAFATSGVTVPLLMGDPPWMPATTTVSASSIALRSWSGSTAKPADERTGAPPGVHVVTSYFEAPPASLAAPKIWAGVPRSNATTSSSATVTTRCMARFLRTVASGPLVIRYSCVKTWLVSRRVHPAWIVAVVAFIALVGAAGFRATPGVLMHPLHDEFGWSLATISVAVSVNLILFGLTAPFAAALMERFGMRRVVAYALLLVAAG